jgi:hypothetical protein
MNKKGYESTETYSLAPSDNATVLQITNDLGEVITEIWDGYWTLTDKVTGTKSTLRFERLYVEG